MYLTLTQAGFLRFLKGGVGTAVEKLWLNIRNGGGVLNISMLDHGVSFAMGKFALTSLFLLMSAFFVMTSSKTHKTKNSITSEPLIV